MLVVSVEEDEDSPLVLDEELVDVVDGASAARKYCPENAEASQLNSVKTLPGEAVVDHKYVRQ